MVSLALAWSTGTGVRRTASGVTVSRISRVLREQISTEAHHRCEYCQTSRRLIGMPLVVDHVIPRSAGGSNARENLVAACYRYNGFKGSETHVIDPATGELVAFFNPHEPKIGHNTSLGQTVVHTSSA